MEEFLQILHEEEKRNYVTKNTHIDVRDLYQGYLDEERKNYTPSNEVRLISWGSNDDVYEGVKKINTADVWISMYCKAIEINPNDAELYYKRALYYEIRSRQDEAIADYSEAIKLRPDYTDALLKRSQCYLKKGLKIEAINDFNKVIRLNSEYASSAVLYGFKTKLFLVDII